MTQAPSGRSDVTSQLAAGKLAHGQGALDDAEQHYLKVLASDSQHAEVLRLLGVIACERADWALAEQYARRALESAPRSGESLHLLGRIRLQQRDLSSAAQLLTAALDVGVPHRAEALLDLASCHSQRKAWPEALATARRLLSEVPRHVAGLSMAGFACFSMGQDAEGLALLDQVLGREPDRHALWHATSVMLQRSGNPVPAYQRAERASQLAPDNAEYAYTRRLAAASAVPDWHFNMVHDTARNEAFASAIAAVVDPSQLVLEIGAGSGLLAMLAARAGAQRVVTCEANALLARAASENVRRNGLSEQVRVIAKPSTQLTVGEDLPERADVLIGEIFSVQVITEGVLPSLEDAKARLLKPGARIIPERAAARGVLVGGDALARKVRAEQVLGLDVSALNAFTPVVQYLQSSEGLTLLSEPVDLFAFELARDTQFPPEKAKIVCTVTSSGTCQGVLQWLRLDLVKGVHFENAPDAAAVADSQHWAPVFYPFPSAVELEAGQSITLRVSHNRVGLRVELAS